MHFQYFCKFNFFLHHNNKLFLITTKSKHFKKKKLPNVYFHCHNANFHHDKPIIRNRTTNKKQILRKHKKSKKVNLKDEVYVKQ